MIDVSVEIILGIVLFVLLLLSLKEYLSNGHKNTPKIKAWIRVSFIFFIVIIFNLLINKN